MTTKSEILDALAGVDDDDDVVFESEDGKRFDLLDSGHKNYKFHIYLTPAEE